MCKRLNSWKQSLIAWVRRCYSSTKQSQQTPMSSMSTMEENSYLSTMWRKDEELELPGTIKPIRLSYIRRKQMSTDSYAELEKAYKCKKCMQIYEYHTKAQECFNSHIHPKLTSVDVDFAGGEKYPKAVYVRMQDNRVFRYFRDDSDE